MASIDVASIANLHLESHDEIRRRTASYYQTVTTNNRLVEWERCRRRFPYFLHYLTMPDANKGRIKYALWPHLIAIAQDWETGDNWIEAKARQLGYSWLLAAYDVWLGTFREHAVILSFSINLLESKELIKKVVALNEGLPWWLRKDFAEQSKTELVWKGTHASMSGLSSTGTGGRSFTATLVQTDEHSFHLNAPEHYAAYRAAIADGGQHISVSTGNGLGNLWASFLLSSNKNSGYKKRFNPWSVRVDRDEAWYEGELQAYMQRVLDPNSPEFGKHPKLFYRENPSKLEDVFETFVGLVFDCFDKQTHLRDPWLEWKDAKWRFAGVDPGQGDPGAINIVAEDQYGNAIALDEKHWPGPMTEDEITSYLMQWHRKAPFNGIAVDGNEGTLIATLVARGLPAFAANKDRGTGIGHVYGRLLGQSLFVSPACSWTETEFGQYEWRKGTSPGAGDSWLTSTPVDHHGDHMDALRYALMALAQAKSQSGSLPERGTQPHFDHMLEGEKPLVLEWHEKEKAYSDPGVRKISSKVRGPDYRRRKLQPSMRRMGRRRR